MKKLLLVSIIALCGGSSTVNAGPQMPDHQKQRLADESKRADEIIKIKELGAVTRYNKEHRDDIVLSLEDAKQYLPSAAGTSRIIEEPNPFRKGKIKVELTNTEGSNPECSYIIFNKKIITKGMGISTTYNIYSCSLSVMLEKNGLAQKENNIIMYKMNPRDLLGKVTPIYDGISQLPGLNIEEKK